MKAELDFCDDLSDQKIQLYRPGDIKSVQKYSEELIWEKYIWHVNERNN